MNWPTERFNVIYADPGWAYDNVRTGGSLKSGAAQKYKVTPVNELMRLPVVDICEKDALCFLWATSPMKPEALAVLAAWSFRYKATVYWHKTGRLGTGFWFRGEVEELLLGVRGHVRPFRSNIRNTIAHPVLAHSEKPECFRQLIEKVTEARCFTRRIELFARKRVANWAAWGDELPELPANGSLEELQMLATEV